MGVVTKNDLVAPPRECACREDRSADRHHGKVDSEAYAYMYVSSWTLRMPKNCRASPLAANACGVLAR
eukprot:10005343-Heterocapsa_arctica.AAC.1